MSKIQKEICYGIDAKRKLMEGINDLANAVKVTLGPLGHTVILERDFGTHYVTKDGVTVAKEVSFKDPIKDMGARIIKDVAIKTNDEAGDGTTTSVVLTQAILNEGIKAVMSGHDVTAMQRGMKNAMKVAKDYINKSASEVTNENIKQIATVSANGDTFIGELLADAVDKVTMNGVITVDNSKTMETYVEVQDGFKIKRGYVSQYFMTDPVRNECVLDNPYILITDFHLSNTSEVLTLLEQLNAKGGSLLIIADAIDGEFLQTLVMNKLRGVLKVAAIKAPGFADTKKEMLMDIAAQTGGQVIASDSGIELKDVTLENLGRAKRVTINKNETVIIGGNKDDEQILSLSASIDQELADNPTMTRKLYLQDRKASLTNGVAVLYVGASSEIEQKEHIIHRDLKLKNIMIKYNNKIPIIGFLIKLSDFGYSKVMNEESMTATNLGTPATKAPEIMFGNDYNSKADLWSVGVIIYQLLFDKLPFPAKNVSQLKEIIRKSNGVKLPEPNNNPISDVCFNLIDRLLQKNPEERIDFDDYFNHKFFTEEHKKYLIENINKKEETKTKRIIKSISNYEINKSTTKKLM